MDANLGIRSLGLFLSFFVLSPSRADLCSQTHHTTEDTFSFKVDKGKGEIPEVVALRTPHALNMHKLAVEYTAKRSGDPSTKAPAFPATYKPGQQA